MSEAIKVVVRIRPMNQKQIQRGCISVVKVDEQNNQISMLKPDEAENVKAFAFDNVFGEDSHQQSVYTKTAYNLVQNVLTGYNGTIFAYGQTGCGKTHSMVGKVQDQNLQGIIPRSFGHILKTISDTTSKQFLIRCSFIQIYNQQVRDLLAKDVKNKLQVKQSTQKGVFVKDLSINIAKTHEELMEYMNIGNKSRSVGETAMNKDSSRSHLLFCLYLQSAQITGGQQKKYVASKLNLVDLAGSERISKTGVSGDRLKQAQKINLSLSALGNVISALVDGKSQHIPYRDSKLTRLLQDSLGGNTKTIMIANCSPADYNFDQTLSTLRYASRAKFIKNKPIINQDPKDALLKQYANQIKNLKRLISQQNGNIDTNDLKSLKDQSQQQFNEKLRQKQLQLHNEKQQKRKLLERIKELENAHVQAKDIHMNNHLVENILKTRIQAQQYSKQAKIKKNSQDAFQEEVRQIQQQSTNQNFSASAAENYSQKSKNVIKKLKTKLKSLEQQLRDIQHENYVQKQQNLQDIRVLSKQNKLLQGIINMLVQSQQLDAIKTQCFYNQDNDEYRIAPFYFKGKQLVFPKLPENQSIDMIRQMQQNRTLIFDQKNSARAQQGTKDQNTKPSPTKVLSSISNNSQYSVKDIIKQARNQKQQGYQLKQQKKINRKVQLQPIRKQF